MGSRSLIAAAAVGWLVGGGVAQAQNLGVDPPESWGDDPPQSWGNAPLSYQESPSSPGPPRGQLGVDLGLYADSVGSADLLVVAPLVWGWYAASDHVGLSFDWGFSNTHLGGTEGTLLAGNPFGGVFYLNRTSTSELRVGGGVALPLVRRPDLPADAFGILVSLAMRGWWNLWLWIPETLSVVAPVRYERIVGSNLLFGTEAALAILVPTTDGVDAEAVLQFAGELAYVAGTVRAGVVLRGVWVLTDELVGTDAFQAVLEPRLTVNFGRGFLRASLSLNLDDPHGFAFDDGGIWGLYIGGGVNV